MHFIANCKGFLHQMQYQQKFFKLQLRVHFDSKYLHYYQKESYFLTITSIFPLGKRNEGREAPQKNKR